MAFTPQKDVNLKILENLNDRDLLNYCRAGRGNQAVRRLCSDEGFWRRRTLQRFENIRMEPGTTWREYYMYRLSHEIVVKEVHPGVRTEVIIDKNSPYMLGLLQKVKEMAKEMEVENKMKLKLKSDDEILRLLALEVALQFQPNIDLDELDLGDLLSVSDGSDNVFDLTPEDIKEYRRKLGFFGFNADFDGDPVRFGQAPQLPGFVLPQMPQMQMPGMPGMYPWHLGIQPLPQIPRQYPPGQLPPVSPPLSPHGSPRYPLSPRSANMRLPDLPGRLPGYRPGEALQAPLPQTPQQSPPASPRSPGSPPRNL